MLGKLRTILSFMLLFSFSAYACEEALIQAGLNEQQVKSLMELKDSEFGKFPFKVMGRKGQDGILEVVIVMGEQHFISKKLVEAVKESKILEVFPQVMAEGGIPNIRNQAELILFNVIMVATALFIVKPQITLKKLKAGPTTMLFEDKDIIRARSKIGADRHEVLMEYAYEYHASEYATMLYYTLSAVLAYTAGIWSLSHLPDYYTQGIDKTSLTLGTLFALNWGLEIISSNPKFKDIPGFRFIRGYGLLKHRDPQMAREILDMTQKMKPFYRGTPKVTLALVGSAHVEGISKELNKEGFDVIYDHKKIK